MPLMKHGSTQTPQFAMNSDGTVAVSDIYLFMNGLWLVTFYVGPSTAPMDSAAFTFCIDG